MSSWNFDVAALKAAADLEDDEPLLPTISETEEREGEEREDMTLTGFPSALAAEFLSATSQHSQSLPQEAPTYISAFGERHMPRWRHMCVVRHWTEHSNVACLSLRSNSYRTGRGKGGIWERSAW